MKSPLEKFSLPQKVALVQDPHGFWKAVVTTPVSTAEVYLQGAHVTSFQKRGEEPLLFMSASHRMDRAHMLHGGIPLCFPWFGKNQHSESTEAANNSVAPVLAPSSINYTLPRCAPSTPCSSSASATLNANSNSEGKELSHGFARISLWELMETKAVSENEVLLRFQLPPATLVAAGWAPVVAELTVVVGEALTLELTVQNTTQEVFHYEECFHSYFLVSDISKATVHGLTGLTYLDKVEDLVAKVESFEALPITREVNRIYLNSSSPLEIHDAGFHRVIRIEKSESHSTVVWNPWEENAKTIPDFQPEDYRNMLCVESGNVREFTRKVCPGEVSKMRVKWSVSRDSGIVPPLLATP